MESNAAFPETKGKLFRSPLINQIGAWMSLIMVACNNQPKSNNENVIKAAEIEKSKQDLIGKQYLLKSNDYAEFKYDRLYSQEGNSYLTTYKNYNPNTGKAIHKITAKYNPQTNLVTVTVKALFGGVFAPDNIVYKVKVKSEFKNDQTSFGNKSYIEAFVGKGEVPWEIKLQFVNNDYTYVNIIEVCTREGADAEWYLLD